MQTVCSQFRLQKVFVLLKLAQFLLISRAKTLFCFHSTFPSTLFTCLRTKATLATSLQTFLPHRRLDLTLPVSDDLVAEKFWTLVERCHDSMRSRSFVSPARKRVTIFTANVLTMHPAQVPDSDPSLCSPRRHQLSLCFEGKMAHLVGVQGSRTGKRQSGLFVVTQVSLQLRERSVSVVASCGSLRILLRWKTFVCSTRTRAGS